MAEIIDKILPRLVEIWETPVYNRPLGSWITLGIMFSFPLWLGIIGWQGYNFYQEYSKLKEAEQNKLAQLRRIETQKRYYRIRLKDIDIAYKLVAKYLTPERIEKLKEDINRLVEETKRKFYSRSINPINPYREETFNYPRRVVLLEQAIPYTLDGLSFTAKSLNDFRQTLNRFYDKDRKNTLHAQVGLKFVNNKLVLYLKKKKDGIVIKRTFLGGVISDARKVPFLTSATYFYRNSKEYPNLTDAFFGWKLEIETKGVEK